MNKTIRYFNHNIIETRKEIIIDRACIIDKVMKLNIDSHLKDPIEELSISYALGLNYIVGKTVPILMEKILLELCIILNVEFIDDIPKQRRRFEEKYGKDFIDILKSSNLIADNEIEVFESLYSKTNILNRNFEIHNRDLTKLKKKGLVTRDEETGVTGSVPDIVKRMVYENPNFINTMNKKDMDKAVQHYVNFIIDFVIKYQNVLNKLTRLPTKNWSDYIETQEKYRKFRITLSNITKQEALEKFSKHNIFEKNLIVKENDNGLECYIIFDKELAVAEVSISFLPEFHQNSIQTLGLPYNDIV